MSHGCGGGIADRFGHGNGDGYGDGDEDSWVEPWSPTSGYGCGPGTAQATGWGDTGHANGNGDPTGFSFGHGSDPGWEPGVSHWEILDVEAPVDVLFP